MRRNGNRLTRQGIRIGPWLALASTAVLWLFPLSHSLRGRLFGQSFQAVFLAAWCATACAALAWFAQIALVGRAVRAGHVSARRAALGWSVAWFGLLAALVLLRDPVAAWLDTATTHLMSHRFYGYDFPYAAGDPRNRDRAQHAAWIARWDSGRIVALEGLFALACVGWMLVAARSRRGAGVAAALGLAALAFAFVRGFDLIVVTYDDFHESVLVGPLLVALCPMYVDFAPLTLLSLFLGVELLAGRWILSPELDSRPAGGSSADQPNSQRRTSRV